MSNEELATETKEEVKPEPVKLSVRTPWIFNPVTRPGYLQPSHSTQKNRYPKIFDSAAKFKPKAKRVLSFGCSTGDELFSLAERFPKAEQLVGVDIDHNSIMTGRRNNKDSRIHFHDTLGALGQFDVITALNVFFCLEKAIPKDQWTKILTEVESHVAPSGIIMIFKSDYDPKELLGDKYKDLNTWKHLHNRNDKEYFCGYYQKKRSFKLW